MNREETKEAIKVMQAYCDGKEIQIKVNGEWESTESPNWSFRFDEYRIKPESTYRPYANAEECFADVLKHDGWVIDDNRIRQISDIGYGGCHTNAVKISNCIWMDYAELLTCVWADDGTPCGVKED